MDYHTPHFRAEADVISPYPPIMFGGKATRTLLKRKGAYMRDPVAKAILAYLANLEDDCMSVTVTELAAALPNVENPRPHIIRFLRQLEEEKLGFFTTGRRGHESRFESMHGVLKNIGQLVDPGSAINQAAHAAKKEPRNTGTLSEGAGVMPVAEDSRSQTLTHPYTLRRDFIVHICLPVDLTTAEASRLAEFIKSLPFQ
jgi:hypothetical protein